MSTRRPLQGKLTPDDLALWRHVTEDVAPLRSRDMPDVKAELDEAEGARLKPKKHNELNGLKPNNTTRKKPSEPPLAPLDRKTHQRLSRGRIGLDGRIDLHGMRQDEAHRQLIAYLKTVQARGGKTVLVITGKGKPKTQSNQWWEDRETGVLRRQVPQWLGQPSLRSVVQGFDEAAGPHGGSGALYVRLRRLKPR